MEDSLKKLSDEELLSLFKKEMRRRGWGGRSIYVPKEQEEDEEEFRSLLHEVLEFMHREYTRSGRNFFGGGIKPNPKKRIKIEEIRRVARVSEWQARRLRRAASRRWEKWYVKEIARVMNLAAKLGSPVPPLEHYVEARLAVWEGRKWEPDLRREEKETILSFAQDSVSHAKKTLLAGGAK